MHSSTLPKDNLHISLGERRGKSDLDRFSLDLSWARAVSDSSRSRAYPSPPMSGSPPNPPRPNFEFSDRGHGTYNPGGQVMSRGLETSQAEHVEQRNQPARTYSQESVTAISYPGTFSMQSMPPMVNQYSQLPHLTQQQQHGDFAPHLPQPQGPYASSERPVPREASDFSSPKQQRKTKGHVASACVPCKRAHLRCDAQRPCSRCLSNGKEDACVDVQHKKRGRPRLRDERESRFEGAGPAYPHPDPSMRRPLPLFTPGEPSQASSFGDPLHRTGSYRVLKSQGPMSGSVAPRSLELASTLDANIYNTSLAAAQRHVPSSPEPACAFLTMDMQIVKASPSFGDTIGLRLLSSRSLEALVVGNDRPKVSRLQRLLEEERREREPHYLPPIYLSKFEEERMIQNIGFGSQEVEAFRRDHQEVLTFEAPDGQQRTFQVRLCLAKKESIYYIIVTLLVPATPLMLQQPLPAPYSRESLARESQPMYGYHTPQQGYVPNPSPLSYINTAGFVENRMEANPYRAHTSAPPSMPSSAMNMPGFGQPQSRSEYSQVGSAPYQIPRSEMQPAPQPRQHDLQLPPIRDPRGEASPAPRADRQGRFDIGGLLEHPGSGQRRP